MLGTSAVGFRGMRVWGWRTLLSALDCRDRRGVFARQRRRQRRQGRRRRRRWGGGKEEEEEGGSARGG